MFWTGNIDIKSSFVYLNILVYGIPMHDLQHINIMNFLKTNSVKKNNLNKKSGTKGGKVMLCWE